MHDALKQQQRGSMCGVNAHHQNGVVERRIRQLQDMTRTSLLQAMMHWKDAITAKLWPYALRKLCDSLNKIISIGIICSSKCITRYTAQLSIWLSCVCVYW
jgi:hypothetical protein